MEEITIEFDKNGSPTIRVGCDVVGQGCKELTAGLEKALGTVTGDTETPEMYANVEQKNRAAY